MDAADIIPTEPFMALDRLNSWIRSQTPLWCPVRSKLKPVIYWVKNKAILDASKRWPIGLRRVMLESRCRVCGGSGVFTPWYYQDEPDDEESCRTCRASGKVVLKFIESTIGPVRWHTPLSRWLSSSLDVYVPFPGEGQWHLADDWKPNQPGKPMEPDEVERDMLTVFREWPDDVAFIIAFHYGYGVSFEHHGKCTDRLKAEEWLRRMSHAETATAS